MERKIVQIATLVHPEGEHFLPTSGIVALTSDGSVWCIGQVGTETWGKWAALPPLPPREDEHCEVSGVKLGRGNDPDSVIAPGAFGKA